jgi:hypothetical protein
MKPLILSVFDFNSSCQEKEIFGDLKEIQAPGGGSGRRREEGDGRKSIGSGTARRTVKYIEAMTNIGSEQNVLNGLGSAQINLG